MFIVIGGDVQENSSLKIGAWGPLLEEDEPWDVTRDRRLTNIRPNDRRHRTNHSVSTGLLQSGRDELPLELQR